MRQTGSINRAPANHWGTCFAEALSLSSCFSPPSSSHSAGVHISVTDIPPVCPLLFPDLQTQASMYLGLSGAHHPDQENLPFANKQGSNSGCHFLDEVHSSAPDSFSVTIQVLNLVHSDTPVRAQARKKRCILFKTAEQTDFRMKTWNTAKQNNPSKNNQTENKTLS